MNAPLNYLGASGMRAQTILPLTWFVLIVAVVVCVVIAILLWAGIRRKRADGLSLEVGDIPIQRSGKGVRWIGIGVAISAVPLLAALVWTMVALAAVSGPPKNPVFALDITAHQWWWEVRYADPDPARVFSTANEIHIPVGAAVLVRLHGGDVIHSFWVPQLSGKTDAIPGQTNQSWLHAERAGRYRGQCSEYCGFQHAHMAFEVVAESERDFEDWRAHQLQPAGTPTTPEQIRGRELVEYRCGLCHRVQGTSAGAVSAPDLTHLMDRRTIAAGTLPNGPGSLAGWIQGAQELKPGSLMPNQGLSGQQLVDVLAYLETLR